LSASRKILFGGGKQVNSEIIFMREIEAFCWRGTGNFEEVKAISNPQLFN